MRVFCFIRAAENGEPSLPEKPQMPSAPHGEVAVRRGCLLIRKGPWPVQYRTRASGHADSPWQAVQRRASANGSNQRTPELRRAAGVYWLELAL